VKAAAKYVNDTVKPTLAKVRKPDEPVQVIIEFQMGPNAQARTIASALLALFYEYEVRLVPPAMKNTIALLPEGKYCFFSEKYKSKYTANKAHAKFNFAHLEKVMGTDIPKLKLDRGHVADAILQIFGMLKLEHKKGKK
jgi:hypothetical protein